MNPFEKRLFAVGFVDCWTGFVIRKSPFQPLATQLVF